jgi:hypothetical protein
MESTTRTYRFVLTVQVEPGHPAYDDPEWAADAAHGALTNEYGLRATYTDITEVDGRSRGRSDRNVRPQTCPSA